MAEIQARYRRGFTSTSAASCGVEVRGDTGEIHGRYRGDAGEILGEIQARFHLDERGELRRGGEQLVPLVEDRAHLVRGRASG